MADYFLDESEDGYGPVFVPKGPWTAEFSEVVKREGVRAVRLSESAGWKGPELDFLSELGLLESVEIYSWAVRDASVVGSLRGLRLLGLECDLRKPIDFAGLTSLEVVKARWSEALEGLLVARTPKRLNVMNWPNENLEPLAAMKGLASLHITSRALTSLAGAAGLTLERLDLNSCPKLVDLEELRKCSRLQHLELSSCNGLTNLSAIGALLKLHKFTLDDCGDIESLAPLRACLHLEELSFTGTTRVADGDLSFLLDLPKLRAARFARRRHYTHASDELIRGTAS